MSEPKTASERFPAELVAIARAARIAGDRDLERVTKRELRDRYGIVLTFTRPTADVERETKR
jgi:hypothetical protein